MRQTNFNGYIFVVDTDHYAGNFERPMTAYVTGCVGECGVGQKEAEMFMDAVPSSLGKRIDDIIESVPDDHGCCRPASIYPTPGPRKQTHYEQYNSVAMFFSKRPEGDLLELMVERTKEYCDNHMSFLKEPNPIKVLSIRLVKEQVVEKEIKRLL